MDEPKIVVLGIGSTLHTDEGVGVRVVEKLMAEHTFPDNVELYDGGATGMHGLLPLIEEADHLVVIDAVNGPGEPGSTYRYDLEDFKLTIPKKLSAHDVGFVECLAISEVNGCMPQSVTVIGIKPKEIKTMCMELTPEIAAKVPELTAMAAREVERLCNGS